MGIKTNAKSIDGAGPASTEARIGDVLRRLRRSRGMSMDALGRRVGITYQQIQKYETGGNRIPASTLYRLAKILGCDRGLFFAGLDDPIAEGEVRISHDDVTAARSLDRIEGPVLKDVLRKLISELDDRQKNK